MVPPPAPPPPAGTSSGLGRFNAASIAIALGVLTLLIALFTPEAPGKSQGGLSSYSTAPGGAGIVYDLAGRFGWHTERRITTLDSLRRRGDTRPTVQVVLAPNEPLGTHEIHNLLENVRNGGGLIFSIDGDDALLDSIGVTGGFRAQFMTTTVDSTCDGGRFTSSADLFAIPPEVREITWTRHAPGRVEPLIRGGPGPRLVPGVGFRMGKGRVAVVGGSDVFSNAAVRVCRLGADIAALRLVEYTRPPGGTNPLPVLVFDEFHHGFGVHGGSLKAAVAYLSHASTGHLFAQALAAGLILLLAMAPRPLAPRTATQIMRRSPLEHAAALGRAYEDVGATRTATSSLIGGLRRRMRGIVAVPSSADDGEFLKAVERRIPSLSPRVDAVNRARTSDTAKRDFAAVGQALATIEEQLQSTPSTRS
jgi:hypothetical protein